MNDEPRAVIVRPGEGARVGNVEFLARTVDTPRFNLGVIDFAAGRVLEPHVHTDEDDSFFILSGEITFMLPEGDVVAGMGQRDGRRAPHPGRGARDDGDWSGHALPPSTLPSWARPPSVAP